MTTPKAMPRPWFVVGRPWNDHPALIYAGSEDPHVGNMVADTESSMHPEADAALIVAAVNNYDRLRRIEAAARAMSEHLDHGIGWMERGPSGMSVADADQLDELGAALRAALDEESQP